MILPTTLDKLPAEPGVYRMLDARGVVLYVGKAAHLKKRVSSYFNHQNISAKTRSLVSQIASIEVSVTRSETEALLLESSFIKSLRPKYNVLMRDDKSYPFLVISYSNDYPRLEMVRAKKKPKQGIFFGPYPSTTALKETLDTLQKVFKIRHCTDTYFSHRTRPCLQYQIKRCSAPCTEFISKQDYQQSVTDATKFLRGKSQEIVDDVLIRMDKAVSGLLFEEAARLRDLMKSLRLIQEQQGLVSKCGDLDVLAIEARPGFACVQCVVVRMGEVKDSACFFPSMPEVGFENGPDSLWREVFDAFVRHYYVEMPSRIPPVIVTDHPVCSRDVVESILSDLRGKSCKLQSSPRGIKAKWLDFAQHNLQKSVSLHLSSAHLMILRYQALCEVVDLPFPIHRMECFDISHTQGIETVASCVVFDEKGPSKRNYRRYLLSGLTPGDDYAAMGEALNRRFKIKTSESVVPDLLIIDGGKGQMSVVSEVLRSLHLDNVFVLGIAKGPSRKPGCERLFLGHEQREIILPADSPALHLLQQIRDEAHRFAITTHRNRRQKASQRSALDSIEGIGSKRRQALLRRFGGLRELAHAPMDEIVKVEGIGDELAMRIYECFH